MTELMAAGRMEWIKLRSLRSTGWILAMFAVGVVGLATLHFQARSASAVPGQSFGGLLLFAPLVGVLGAMMITGEYASGLIRTTLAAVARRPVVLAAKAAVVGAVTLVIGEGLAVTAFFVGEALHAMPHASLAQGSVARAVLMSGAVPGLIALLGLGLGTLARHTAGALCLVFGILFVLPILVYLLPLAPLRPYMPVLIAYNSLGRSQPAAGALGPWPGLLVMCLYAAAALAAGCTALVRRDA
jgi:ABC-type transport system involved in multi-copper enzyme maturation permease subunit